LTYSFSHRNAPWLIAFLLVFIVYQGYELIVAFSWGLLLLTASIFIVYLAWCEHGIHRYWSQSCLDSDDGACREPLPKKEQAQTCGERWEGGIAERCDAGGSEFKTDIGQ
jgi:hypothetical protein